MTDLPPEERVARLSAYYRRVHGALMQAGYAKGILGHARNPLRDRYASEPGDPMAHRADAVLAALGVKAPEGWRGGPVEAPPA